MSRNLPDWSLATLLEPYALAKVPPVPVTGLVLDSRLVQSGDVYLAVAGASTHGIRFARSAVDAGAVAVLVSASEPDARSVSEDELTPLLKALRDRNIPVIEVPDLDNRCDELAARFYDNPDQKVKLIAVTGTDGKTSVCRFIASALNDLERPCGYIGTLGWGIGAELAGTDLTTPDVISLRRMLSALYRQGADYIVLEASSHGIAEGRLNGLCFDIAVLTNVGRDHLDYHKTLEAYRQTKASLFYWPSLHSVVLNGADSLGQELASRLPEVRQPPASNTDTGTETVLYCDTDSDKAVYQENLPHVCASEVDPADSGLRFTLTDRHRTSRVSTRLLGRFNVENLLACYCTLLACGVPANDAVHALSTLPPVPGRMERLGSPGQPTVVVDYCHTPQALASAIDAVRVHCQGSLWVVFGCGGDRDTGKRIPMAQAAEQADFVVLTDDNPRTEDSSSIIRNTLAGFEKPEAVSVIPDRAAAIGHAISSAASQDLVLIAGKGHEDYQQIGEQKLPFSDREQALAALELAS